MVVANGMQHGISSDLALCGGSATSTGSSDIEVIPGARTVSLVYSESKF